MQWNLLDYIAVLLVIAAGSAYLNHYFLGLPRNSGLLVVGLMISLGIRGLDYAFPGLDLDKTVRWGLQKVNFGPLLLDVFLGFLLFASTLTMDLEALWSRKGTILALASVGVLMSTLLVGIGMSGAFALIGLDIPLSYCFVFGALISPTDPVTVSNVLARMNVPSNLHAVISGESMFNDGMGIVLFNVFLRAAESGGAGSVDPWSVALDILREAGGGFLLGGVAGGVAFLATKGIDEYTVELIISLALVTGVYGLAQTIGVSGPVAVVVSGLIMGSIGVRHAVSAATHDYLSKFWSLVDGLLNALLFLLIGFELVAIPLKPAYLAAAGLAIPLTLAVRLVSVAVPGLPLNFGAPHKSRAIALLTWSGLRGGISVALALSLPASAYREPFITACYAVAIFTMVVQGLSLEPVTRRLFPQKMD